MSGADTLFPLAVEENTLLTYQKYPRRISTDRKCPKILFSARGEERILENVGEGD